MPDSQQIEHDLQQLSWEQFRRVIESVPKMKADVDAYGALGWSFVQANYRNHAWRKNVERLDEMQKQRLVELIAAAKAAPEPGEPR